MKYTLLLLTYVFLKVQGQSVTLQSNSSSVLLGQGFQFSCVVTGVTSFQGLLYFNRDSSTLCTVDTADCSQFSNTRGYSCGCANVAPGDFYSNITSVTLQDDNEDWRCQYGGMRSDRFSLDVNYAPVLSLPSETNVTENTKPNIDCSSHITPGNPSSTSYLWAGPDGYNKTGAVLDRTVTRTQGGQYSCTATNTAGLSDTADIYMNVQYPPTIEYIDRNQNVTENTYLDIDCSANVTFGNPASTHYTWTGPGGYIENGPVLDRTVTRTQGGIYTCTASNTAGLSDTTDIDITVFYAPSLMILQDLNTTENTNLQIDCSRNITSGNPPDTMYEWTDPGGNIHSGHKLDINISRNGGGQYSCTATNSAGLSDRALVFISVQYPPRISVPNNKNVTETSNVKIDCSNSITPGNPSDISYEWTGPNGYNSTGAILDTSITRTEGGQYSCTATNSAGLSDIAQTNINVQFMDSPTLTISKSQVMENDSVQLVCNVTSNPTVQMTIRNVDNKTILVNQEKTNSRVYNIERVQCLHNGTYDCMSENREINRNETDSSSLNVLCSPRHDFRKVLKPAYFRNIGESATITADVISNPTPEFTWWKYLDDQLEPISDYTNHNVNNRDLQSTLQITVTHLRDYGTYVLKMENIIGENRLFFTLSPITAPLPPEEVKVVNVSSSDVTIQWKSNSNGGSEQTFSTDYKTETSTWNEWRSGILDPGKGMLISSQVKGLTQNTKYLLGVYAKNRYGISGKITKEVKTMAASNSVEVNKGLVIGLSCLGALLIFAVIIIIILVVRCLKRKRKPQEDSDDNTNVQNFIKMEASGNASGPSGNSTGYDGTDGGRESHYYEYIESERKDAETDMAIDSKILQGSQVEHGYVSQPTYVNESDTSKDQALYLQPIPHGSEGNSATIGSSNEAGEYINS